MNEGQIQDKRLLQLIANGDEVAFKTLFEKYRGKLYTYLRGITKSPEVSEEIVMDVFLKIWMPRGFDRYESRESFGKTKYGKTNLPQHLL